MTFTGGTSGPESIYRSSSVFDLVDLEEPITLNLTSPPFEYHDIQVLGP